MSVGEQQLTDWYLEQLLGLLPTGKVWEFSLESNFAKILRAWGRELARIHKRGETLALEANPLFAVELLAEWERVLGLPDPCELSAATIQGRQAAVAAKLAYSGGQSPSHFVGLAKLIGFDIEIEEHAPFRVGHTGIDQGLCGDEWVYAWTVHAPEHMPVFFTAGLSGPGDPLVEFESAKQLLECMFEARKPAHTVVQFAYDLPFLGYSPWTEVRPGPIELSIELPPVRLDFE